MPTRLDDNPRPEISRSRTTPATLLALAAAAPRLIGDAHRHLYRLSLRNQILVAAQCRDRGLEIGECDTYDGWIERGRPVRERERALALCRFVDAGQGLELELVRRWFVRAQTVGLQAATAEAPAWSLGTALTALSALRIGYTAPQGFAGACFKRFIAINPHAGDPRLVALALLAHQLLGHADEVECLHPLAWSDNLEMMAAAAAAMLAGGAIGVDGAACHAQSIRAATESGRLDDRVAAAAFATADRLLAAGRGPHRRPRPAAPGRVPGKPRTSRRAAPSHTALGDVVARLAYDLELLDERIREVGERRDTGRADDPRSASHRRRPDPADE